MDRVDKFIKNPKKALFKLSAPIIVAMLVQTLYSIVDTAFVGRLGPESIAALTFSFPIFFILISINSGIASGMSALIAQYLGGKNKSKAENAAMHGLLISIFMAFVLFILGIFFLENLFSIFGASGTTLELAVGYTQIIMIGIFLMFPAYVFNNIFAAQGDTKTPMVIQIIALVTNIILDPIFIYYLGYGVKGAAIATTIAFGVSLVLYLTYIQKKSQLCIRTKCFVYSVKLVKDIFRIGVPASAMMLITSIYVIFINRFMVNFGVNYVAMFGITTRLESLAVMPIIAISISLMTLAGMFYGAKRYDLLKGVTWYGMKVSIVYAVLLGLLFYSIPAFFLRIFTPNMNLINTGIPYLRIDILTFPLMAIAIISSRTLQALGQGMPGLFINLTRVLLVTVPLAYIFVYVLGFGYLSIVWAMVVGGVASNIVALTLLRSKINKITIKS